MKKLRDIFELPVTGVDVQGKDVYHAQPENDKIADDAIAHVINHVDLLADALEALVSDYIQYRAVNGIDLTDDHCAKLDVKMSTAEQALKAYRGEK